tara:strand:+ start:544 stop:813 length:270 start_codon:yes stop_codon:yes gene_type:complete
MLNKIYRIVDKTFEIIGYNFVGYKVDIKLLEEKINTLNDKIKKDISLSRINASIEIDNNINTLNKKIEAVEVLFNNINEINYINKKGSK